MAATVEGLRLARQIIVVLVGFTVAVPGGCADRGPQIVKVTGTVTCGGKPVANLLLNFKPNQGRPSWAVTDASGRYSLHYDKDHQGAVVGRHTVWVHYRPRDPDQEMSMLLGGFSLPKEIAAILEKYGSEDTTPLRFDIRKGNQVLDISLD